MKAFVMLFAMCHLGSAFNFEELRLQKKSGDYEKCFELVAKISVEISKIVDDIQKSSIPDVILQVGLLLKDSYSAVECFIHNSGFKDIIAPQIEMTFGKFITEKE